MRRLLVVVLLVASACTTSSGPSTTTSFVVGVTEPMARVTTTVPMTVEYRGCSSPQVTFSPLCEIYELLETWYIEAVDPAQLAALAVEGVAGLATDITEDPPRTLICSVPHQEFTVLCDALAETVIETGVPLDVAVEGAIGHMVDIGLDPFTYYLPPDQAGSVRLNGIVGGIGVLLDARDAIGSKCAQITSVCQLEIVVVLEDNPGFDAGLTPGDIITSLDGEPVEGKGFTATVALIAGDETGQISITVDRDGTELEFAIERAELVVPTVVFGLPRDDVGYIRIPDFEWDIPMLVDEALAEIIPGPGTLIIDLRDNPGGYLDVFLETVDRFVDGGPVAISDFPDEHLEYTASPGGAATSQRLLVLVNQGTASAAEALTGALRERRNALVLGTDTFGKDAVQIPFTLRNGGEFNVTVAHWSTPNGDTVRNGGFAPDRVVEWESELIMEELVDLALEAAS